jgi:hypothetical protein
MTKSLLDAWLDLTLGKVSQERLEHFRRFGTFDGLLSPSPDADHRGPNGVVDIATTQNLVRNELVEEGDDNGTAHNG